MSETIERDLEVFVGGRRVPAVLWTPGGMKGPFPIVLVGHGGGGHKRVSLVVDMAKGFAKDHGIATLAIDGPVNGDREANTAEALQLREKDPKAYRLKYYTDKYDEMVEDWQAALEVAMTFPEISKTAVGYWGVSMGTRFGLPLVAAEKRVKAAVLGLFGYGQGASANQRVYEDAPKINVPVLFLQQLADEMIPNKAYWDLFQMLGTQNKRLHASPGGHVEIPAEEKIASRWYLANRLAEIES
ncbi:MAG: dienelactone hydrolase family protein [Desulfobacteraceae bacterium]|nr:dienelactone hydrolase family protein [Desulfobacteraceae bacterium]